MASTRLRNASLPLTLPQYAACTITPASSASGAST
eukprot:CAMPEP_0197618828 /NCGR_PEP_ID=MMETSP1326-20131121/61734_1 /TAXON_ID=1155430 /ORGANISM="Genus nov. species nov., Strain RCC2288" /LENGTH=34 /DNA_ID= /DNA_START= /DNA_END= /DNA_ORIENTATION=